MIYRGVNMSARMDKRFKNWVLLLLTVSAFALTAHAQFSSGSTGADGALDYSSLPANSTVVFDPSKFNSVPHPPGQNTFNFTTINIPTGITVILSNQLLNGPVFWLATGDVVINGTIQLSGQNGPDATSDTSLRVPAIPGPGGYPGGIGGRTGSEPQSGYGPGGGAAGLDLGGSGDGHQYGQGGRFTGNAVFAPPIGGSGGGGGFCNDGTNFFGPGGGAGGGALVIAGSTSIILSGSIDARGGSNAGGCNVSSGGGAGGSVELAANTITGAGIIRAASGAPVACCGVVASNGAIRLEAVQLPVSLSTDIVASQSAPGAFFQPNLPVSIQIVSIGGVQVANPALGRFQNPDAVINSSSPVSITIQTTGIPPGTVMSLNVYSEDGSIQVVQTTPLLGTIQSATATASATFPPDLSLTYIKATWTQ